MGRTHKWKLQFSLKRRLHQRDWYKSYVENQAINNYTGPPHNFFVHGKLQLGKLMKKLNERIQKWPTEKTASTKIMEGLPAMWEMVWAISKRTSFLKKSKIFFEILFPKTKPITVRIIYLPPNQNNFLQTLNENFVKLNILKKELYVLGDFNINLYHNQDHTACKNNNLVSATASNGVKSYLQFCAMFGLTQIVKSFNSYNF